MNVDFIISGGSGTFKEMYLVGARSGIGFNILAGAKAILGTRFENYSGEYFSIVYASSNYTWNLYAKKDCTVLYTPSLQKITDSGKQDIYSQKFFKTGEQILSYKSVSGNDFMIAFAI